MKKAGRKGEKYQITNKRSRERGGVIGERKEKKRGKLRDGGGKKKILGLELNAGPK